MPELKRIKKLRVNSTVFDVVWDKKYHGGRFIYNQGEKSPATLRIGCGGEDAFTFEILCHELWEICAIEMEVRLNRRDCDSDYIFVYDHRQHTTMCNMFSGLLSQFLQ